MSFAIYTNIHLDLVVATKTICSDKHLRTKQFAQCTVATAYHLSVPSIRNVWGIFVAICWLLTAGFKGRGTWKNLF